MDICVLTTADPVVETSKATGVSPTVVATEIGALNIGVNEFNALSDFSDLIEYINFVTFQTATFLFTPGEGLEWSQITDIHGRLNGRPLAEIREEYKNDGKDYSEVLNAVFGQKNWTTYKNREEVTVVSIKKPVLSAENMYRPKFKYRTEVFSFTPTTPMERAAAKFELLSKMVFPKHDYSVSEWANPTEFTGSNMYGVMGNSVQSVFEDFWAGEKISEKSYPNMTKEQVNTLVKSFRNFEQKLNAYFGGARGTTWNLEWRSSHLRLQGTFAREGQDVRVQGVPDFIIYDNKGNFYIGDLKSKNSAGHSANDIHYDIQTEMYAEMWKQLFPAVGKEGKVKGRFILELSNDSQVLPYSERAETLQSKSQVIGTATKDNYTLCIDKGGKIEIYEQVTKEEGKRQITYVNNAASPAWGTGAQMYIAIGQRAVPIQDVFIEETTERLVSRDEVENDSENEPGKYTPFFKGYRLLGESQAFNPNKTLTSTTNENIDSIFFFKDYDESTASEADKAQQKQKLQDMQKEGIAEVISVDTGEHAYSSFTVTNANEGIQETENTNTIFDANIITAEERAFLSKSIMHRVSYMISVIQANPEKYQKAAIKPLSKGMSRTEIIEAMRMNRLINSAAREMLKDVPGRSERANVAIAKAREYVSTLVELGYSFLIDLEDVSIKQVSTIHEGLNAETISDIEKYMLEGGQREAWTTSIKQISARAGLSTSVKRRIARYVAKEWKITKDENGNTITSRVVKKHPTFKIAEYIDADEAITLLYDITQNCFTLEEMKKALKKKSSDHAFLVDVLNDIENNEQFASEFFSNFRKNRLTYSTVYLDVDENGNAAFKTIICNTASMPTTLLSNIRESYSMGKIAVYDSSTATVNEDVLQPIAWTFQQVNPKAENSNIIKDLDKLSTEEGRKKAVSQIAKVVRDLGIMLTDSEIASFLDAHIVAKQEDKNASTSLEAIMQEVGDIINYFSSKKGNKNKDVYPFDSQGKEQDVYGFYKRITDIVGEMVRSNVEHSVYDNGKMYYCFQPASFLVDLVNRLTSTGFETFIEKEFSGHRFFNENSGTKIGPSFNNILLQELTESSDFRENFAHKVQLSFNHVAYKDLDKISQQMSMITEYFYDENGKWAWYRVPILSNKPSSEWIKAKKYKRKEIQEWLAHKTISQEILRIKTTIEKGRKTCETLKVSGGKVVTPSSNTNRILNCDFSDEFLAKHNKLREALTTGRDITFDDLIEDGRLITEGTGGSFHFLKSINKEITGRTALGKAILTQINGKRLDDTAPIDGRNTEKDLFDINCEKAIDRYLTEIESSELQKFRDMDLFQTTTFVHTYKEGAAVKKVILPIYSKLKNFSSQEEVIKIWENNKNNPAYFKDGKVTDLFTQAVFGSEGRITKKTEEKLKNFIVNDSFMAINLIQLGVTDLAYFKNMEEFQKRWAAVHSPGIKLNKEATYNGEKVSDGYCRVMHISDQTIKSDLLANLDAALSKWVEAATTPEDRNTRRLMKGNMLEEYKKINVTDGQGYSSITSYRKKMVMKGVWAPAHEALYDKLRSGTFSASDLKIIMQPLKPFIFTNMSKNTGLDNGAMSTQRVAMQVKDSEYMLFIAEALTRGQGQNSILSGLADFMESTHYDSRGKYQTNGIDTIAFASTSKFGAMAVANITEENVQKYQEEYKKRIGKKISKANAVRAILYQAAYTEENGKKVYNQDYVHTIDYDNYSIQQEVPAHMVDSTQAEGSQIRILSISDITPGMSFILGKDLDGNDIVLTAEQLRKEYNELHAANIKATLEQLKKEFGITVNTNSEEYKELLSLYGDEEKAKRVYSNRRLEAKIKGAALSEIRYGADLIRACTLDPNTGEFIIPLQEQIQTVRIQELLNSIVKKSIYKQRFNGGPVVQTTSFGTAEELSVRFKDKNGKLLPTLSQFAAKKNISKKEAIPAYEEYVKENQGSLAYWEVYMPIPSKELEQTLIDAAKKDGYTDRYYIANVDLAISNGVISEEELKAIGYRIPTEDKYSMAPMRIKGFISRELGEAVFMPAEVTAFTGSDFDIDKMYIMFKDFDYKSSFYNLEVSQSDREVIYSSIKKQYPEIIKTIDKVEESSFSQDQLFEIFGEIYNQHPEIYHALQKVRDDAVAKGEKKLPLNRYFEKIAHLTPASYNGDWKAYKQDLVGQAASDLNMIPTIVSVKKDGYEVIDREECEKRGLNPYTVFKEIAHKKGIQVRDKALVSRENKNQKTRGGRNNRIFDLEWAVLTSEDVFHKAFNPGGFNPEKQMSKIIQIKQANLDSRSLDELKQLSLDELDAILATNKDDHSILLSSNQTYFQQQNMVAAKIVGIAANNNVAHAFCNMHDDASGGIKVTLKEGKGAGTRVGYGFTINGKSLDNLRLDALYDLSGNKLISKTIAEVLAASVDAAKEPTLNFFNLNTFTSSTFMLLLRLGFDVDTVSMLTAQPGIRLASDIYFADSNDGGTSQYTSIQKAIKRIQESFPENSAIRKFNPEINMDSVKITKENLFNGLTDTPIDKMTEEQAQQQLLILAVWQKLLPMARQLSTLTGVTKYNSISNAPGPTIADTEVKRRQYEDFKTVFSDANSTFFTSTNGVNSIVDNNPILSAFWYSVQEITDSIFAPHFLQYTNGFRTVIQKMSNYTQYNIDSKTYNKILSQFTVFLLTRPNINVLDGSFASRESLFYDFPADFDKRVAKFKNNLFIQTLFHSSIRKNGERTHCIDARLGGYSSTQIESLKNAISDLVVTREGRELMTVLNKYALIRFGFTFSPKGWLQVNSVDSKQRFPGYLDALRDNTLVKPSGEGYSFNPYHFILQYARNNPNDYQIVPRIKQGELYQVFIGASTTANKRTLTLKFNINNRGSIPPFLNRTSLIDIEGAISRYEVAPIYNYMGTLYRLVSYTKDNRSTGDGILYFEEIPPLGIENNLLEYNAVEDGISMESVRRKGQSRKLGNRAKAEQNRASALGDLFRDSEIGDNGGINPEDIDTNGETIDLQSTGAMPTFGFGFGAEDNSNSTTSTTQNQAISSEMLNTILKNATDIQESYLKAHKAAVDDKDIERQRELEKEMGNIDKTIKELVEQLCKF